MNRVLEMVDRVKLWEQFRRGEELILPKEYGSESDYVEYHCLRCNHTMKVPSKRGEPRVCYVCGSRYWNDKTRHGMRRMTQDQKMHSMLLRLIVDRCYNPSSPSYRHYGGRGIKVSDEWYSHEYRLFKTSEFSKWCREHGWRHGLQIDRIDNEKGYEPDNCRFVSATVNLRNRRNNINVTIKGETKCIGEWSEIYGVNYHTLRHRILRGWVPERAVLIPSEYNRPHLCFHKSLNGKWCTCDEKRKKCSCDTEELMRCCPRFHEFTKDDKRDCHDKNKNVSVN